jgi:hypothetical protein
MKLLIDTHLLLWASEDRARLPVQAADLMAGIWTPIAALQDDLATKLMQHAGISVRLEAAPS